MNQEQYIDILRRGLRGAPADQATEIVDDYISHFAEGRASGRSENEIAAALGDPERLAKEIRMESGLRKWEERKTPSSMVSAISALLGLATVDIALLIPTILVAFVMMVLLLLVLLVIACVGLIVTIHGFSELASLGPERSAIGTLFSGVGLLSGVAGVGALLILLLSAAMNALMRYGRLHYRILNRITIPEGAVA